MNSSDISHLKSALLKEDDVGKVIHTHINIEYIINDFLELMIKSPKYLNEIRLDYSGKVHLSLCLGLPEELKSPLISLGKMRNDFAHKLHQNIDKHRVNNFFNTFSQIHKNEIMNIADDQSLSWVSDGVSWCDIKPNDKFTVICISLYYLCKLAIIEILNDKKHVDHLINLIKITQTVK